MRVRLSLTSAKPQAEVDSARTCGKRSSLPYRRLCTAYLPCLLRGSAPRSTRSENGDWRTVTRGRLGATKTVCGGTDLHSTSCSPTRPRA